MLQVRAMPVPVGAHVDTKNRFAITVPAGWKLVEPETVSVDAAARTDLATGSHADCRIRAAYAHRSDQRTSPGVDHASRRGGHTRDRAVAPSDMGQASD